MLAILRCIAFMASLAMLSACVSIPLAPGADQIRFTNVAADVASCRAVGNVKVPDDTPIPPTSNIDAEARNLTVGLGGNVLFVTVDPQGTPTQGVAYRCD